MTTWYPLALAALLDGLVSGGAPGGTPTVVALDSSYTYSAAHDFADDLTGQLGDAIALTTVAFTAGVLTADNAGITGTSGGDVVAALAVYVDTGTPSTSPLLVFIDTNGDSTPMSFTSDGSTITIAWQSGQIASI